MLIPTNETSHVTPAPPLADEQSRVRPRLSRQISFQLTLDRNEYKCSIKRTDGLFTRTANRASAFQIVLFWSHLIVRAEWLASGAEPAGEKKNTRAAGWCWSMSLLFSFCWKRKWGRSSLYVFICSPHVRRRSAVGSGKDQQNLRMEGIMKAEWKLCCRVFKRINTILAWVGPRKKKKSLADCWCRSLFLNSGRSLMKHVQTLTLEKRAVKSRGRHGGSSATFFVTEGNVSRFRGNDTCLSNTNTKPA